MGLIKRGDTFHFRYVVPGDLNELVGRSEAHATLWTGTRRVALQTHLPYQSELL